MSIITNYFITWWEDKTDYFSSHLHWNSEIQAPVSNIMTYEEYIDYDTYGTEFIMVYVKTTDDLDNLVFRQLVEGNKAGRHGETVTWEEIKELYRGPF